MFDSKDSVLGMLISEGLRLTREQVLAPLQTLSNLRVLAHGHEVLIIVLRSSHWRRRALGCLGAATDSG